MRVWEGLLYVSVLLIQRGCLRDLDAGLQVIEKQTYYCRTIAKKDKL